MNCYTAVITLCFVAISGCGYMPPFQDQKLIDRVGDSAILACTSADTINFYKIESGYSVDADGSPLQNWSLDLLAETFPIEGVGRELSSNERSRLVAILGWVSLYDLDNVEPCECWSVEPEYVFEFKNSHSTRYVFVGLRCRQVVFRDEDGGGVPLVLRRGVGDLERLIEQLIAPIPVWSTYDV